MEPVGYLPFSLNQSWDYHEQLNSQNSQPPELLLTEEDIEAWAESCLATSDHVTQSLNPSAISQAGQEQQTQAFAKVIATTFSLSPEGSSLSPTANVSVETPSASSSFRQRVRRISSKTSKQRACLKIPSRPKRKIRHFLTQTREKTALRHKNLHTMMRVESLCQLYVQGFPSSQGIALRTPQNLDTLPQQQQNTLKFAACQSDLPRLFEGVVLESISRLEETQSREAALLDRITKLEQENQRMKNLLNGWKMLLPFQG